MSIVLGYDHMRDYQLNMSNTNKGEIEKDVL